MTRGMCVTEWREWYRPPGDTLLMPYGDRGEGQTGEGDLARLRQTEKVAFVCIEGECSRTAVVKNRCKSCYGKMIYKRDRAVIRKRQDEKARTKRAKRAAERIARELEKTMEDCSEDDCARGIYAKGMCSMHYHRKLRASKKGQK